MLLLNSFNKRFISKNGLDLVEKPDQYFSSYSLVRGMITYKGVTYNIKKIQLDEEIKPDDLPEVQLINLNANSPYLLKYIDYIVEQEESDGFWKDKAVYILMETSDYDLKTYVTKYGQLCLEDALGLTECLIGANYYLQKCLEMPHGDIKPQNIRIVLSNNNQESKPIFKLSYFWDTTCQKMHKMCNSKDTLAYMAPELLCSSFISSKYSTQEQIYAPCQELETLITECPNEIRYDPFRSDVFSAGLTIFSAATSIFFSIAQFSNTFETIRNGPKEIFLISQHLKTLKIKHQCDGLIEILRIMMTHNPLLRYDFEELNLRLAKLNMRDPRIPKIQRVTREGNIEEEFKLLKERFIELQGYAVRMREREVEFQNIINQLKEQLDHQIQDNEINTRKTLDIEDQPIEFLNEISSIASILEEHTSFLSPTHRKVSGSTDPLEKKFDFLDVKLLTKNNDNHQQLIKEARENLLPRRQLSVQEVPKPQKPVKHDCRNINHGKLTHIEIKDSIIKRRETSDLKFLA